jgi:hypothetical protein
MSKFKKFKNRLHGARPPNRFSDIDTTIMLANRTIHECRGILCNIVVFIGSFVYPVDFHVVSMPMDPNHASHLSWEAILHNDQN